MKSGFKNSRRSVSCNVQLLRELRLAKGLTQTELARIAGYSDRLISKAESGCPISQATVEVLAQALCSEDRTVLPEELIVDPLSLAREFVAGLHEQRADIVSRIRHFLDDKIVIRVAGDPQFIPFAGEHRGIAAVDRLYRTFFSVLEVPVNYCYEDQFSYFPADNEVMIWGESWLHPIGRPLSHAVRVSLRLRFEQGKLVELDQLFDTQFLANNIEIGASRSVFSPA